MVRTASKEDTTLESLIVVMDWIQHVFLQLYRACLVCSALGLTFSEERRGWREGRREAGRHKGRKDGRKEGRKDGRQRGCWREVTASYGPD